MAGVEQHAQPLSQDMQQTTDRLRKVLERCSDVVFHPLNPARGVNGCLVFTDGLVDDQIMDRHLLDPLLRNGIAPDAQTVVAQTTTVAERRVVTTLEAVVQGVLSGDAALLIEGCAAAVLFNVRAWIGRAVSEPTVEATIRGPKDSFVETLRHNTALLRRRIKSPALKMESLKLGRLSHTSVVVAYIEGVASAAVVDEIRRRICAIDVDGILEGGQVEQYIEEAPFSPFPQMMNTERPDTVAANLLEGRVAVIVDGSPFVLLAPAVFAQFMQAAEDYYERFLSGTVVRMLRYLFLTVALLLPSLYVAIITFHQEMIPTELLLSIAESREGVPFPALVEALSMEIAFEILREAGIRLPRPVGQAVSIVGALVVGDAAVRAGIVSSAMVIVVAITGIASFAIPKYSAGLAIRILRFPLMFLGASLGLFGVVAGFGALLLHLCSLKSFGVPYLSPVAPMRPEGIKDVAIRAPLWLMPFRPWPIAGRNRVRQDNPVGRGGP